MSAVTTNLLAELQLKKRKKRLVVMQQWRMIASDTDPPLQKESHDAKHRRPCNCAVGQR
jgi:hypothetical protein